MFISLLGLLLALGVPVAHASRSSVINTINVSSNTGGQNAAGGTVTEGTSVRTVDIVTEVDGEVVEEVHESRTDSDPFSIVRTTTSSTSDARVYTSVDMGTDPTPAQARSGDDVRNAAAEPVRKEHAPEETQEKTEEDTSEGAPGEVQDITTLTEGTSSGATSTTPARTSVQRMVDRVFASVARVMTYVFTLFS